METKIYAVIDTNVIVFDFRAIKSRDNHKKSC